jgi:Tetratricopeptide repeat
MSSAGSPIARQSVGRTFIVAVSVLGVIALGQLGAVGWVFVNRFQTLTERAKSGPGSRLINGNAVFPGDLASTETNEKLDTSNPFGDPGSSGDDPIFPPSRPSPMPMAKLNPPPPPPETRFQELLQQGRQLRERGDTAAALVRFREAQTQDPENPEAIADIAVTYERMGLMDKASEQWKRIYEMGDSAGAFYVAAEARLKMSQAQALAAVQMAQQNEMAKDGPISKFRTDATLGIGEVTKSDRGSVGGVTRFILRVPIRAKRTEKIAVGDVDIQVFFYDQVDGKSIVQTDADLSYRFASSPIDWAGLDPETLEVEYSRQPPLVRTGRPEKREFYGYIIRLYHKGQLQDLRAQPDSLKEEFPAPPTLDASTPPK